MTTLSRSHTSSKRAQAAVECSGTARPLRRAQAAVECSGTARPLRRAQAAVEVLAYAAFFFMVFVGAVAVFIQVQGNEITRAENAYAQEIAYGFADNIHTAFVAGPGFVESISMPKDILGKRYWLFVSIASDASAQETGAVYVNWESMGKNASFSAPTVTANYDFLDDGSGGFVTKSGNYIVIDAIQGKMINISNVNGTVKIQRGSA